MKSGVRVFIFAHPVLVGNVLKLFNHLNLHNRLSVGANKLSYRCAWLKDVKIRIEGKGNQIVIGDYSQLIHCSIYIHGDNNLLEIGDRCYLNCSEFYMEDDRNSIHVGFHCSTDGKTHFAAIEGTSISVGNDCMFSADINVRTGDAHSLLNQDGKRYNRSADIMIGDHCWIGMRAILLKGSRIGSNSVIAASTVVSKSTGEENVILAGIPAKVVKRNINWSRERITMYTDQE